MIKLKSCAERVFIVIYRLNYVLRQIRVLVQRVSFQSDLNVIINNLLYQLYLKYKILFIVAILLIFHLLSRQFWMKFLAFSEGASHHRYLAWQLFRPTRADFGDMMRRKSQTLGCSDSGMADFWFHFYPFWNGLRQPMMCSQQTD